MALGLCAYAGGQARRGGAAPAAERDGVALTAIKSRARSGRAAKAGPSANVGQTIRLTGTGFDENVSVEFMAFANSSFLVGAAEVKRKRASVAVPEDVVTGPVKLSDPETGVSNPLTLQIVPEAKTFTPEMPAAGQRLLIDGTGFTPEATVVFKGVDAPVTPTVVSPTRIDLIVPATAQTGKVTVVTNGGTSKPVKLKIAPAAGASAEPATAAPAKTTPARAAPAKVAPAKAAPARATSRGRSRH